MLTNPVHFGGEFLRQRMDEFETSRELRSGVVDVVATARRRGCPDLFEVTMAILQKVTNGTLTSTDDLVQVEQLFRKARLDEIGDFLRDGETTIKEFRARIDSRHLIENIEHVTHAMELRAAASVPYSTVERQAMKRLKQALLDDSGAAPTP